MGPFWTGGWLAVAAAFLFGVTTPLVKRAGEGLGPFTTAALLYLGAAAVAFTRPRSREARLTWADAPRVAAIAACGALAAPALLAWGLQRTSGAGGSLLLNFEAAFTVLLARALYREPIGRRVASALLLTIAAGALLAR